MDTQNTGSNVKVFAVIPARYASIRLPGKPLASIAGRPMIQHVVERTRQAARVARVVVATDDDRIKKAVEEFGGEAVLTRRDHRTGTDRVAEIAAHLEADIYVNIQGDEPLIDPVTIDAVVAEMLDDDSIQIATPCTAITQGNDVMDPNIVKVVRDFDGNCLIFRGRRFRGCAIQRLRLRRIIGSMWVFTRFVARLCLNFLRFLRASSRLWNSLSSFGGLKMVFAF